MLYNELSGLLFHGSNVKVSDIDLSKGALKKDFGNGFYTTSFQKQADKFAEIKAKRNSVNTGYVSVFEFYENIDLKIMQFETADLNWLDFVLFNRGFVKENILIYSYDIIIGPVANDTVGLVLNQLIVGTYGSPLSSSAKEMAIKLLKPEKLYNQVLFKTEKSIECLRFKEVYPVAINR
ncbi:MAG: DUF3990 domain-containing protein [Fibromonadaceae bacterium]|jgi:hypothetical protein|nr:DUF3990 domain-containing protein [Fibromonadaceae bacterium]